MCGIAGILELRGGRADPAAVRRMVDTIVHRGPDARGLYAEDAIGLGHARLSILDLERGAQPMASADGSLRIVFNGEIFNYLEIREALVRDGRKFRTASDTEVVLEAYAAGGEGCVREFNGQWAFAIWDRRRRRLFLSRDRLGVRPLFYACGASSFRFASEAKALLADPSVDNALDLEALDQIFTFWCPIAPRTAFRGIHELPPGHNLVMEDGTPRIRRYWQLDYAPSDEAADAAAWAGRLRDLLDDAVRLRLRADVPVGAYLSGGLDSSIVTALASRRAGDGLETFSVTFDDPEFDEAEFQRATNEYLRVERHRRACTPEDVGAAFPEVVRHAERPVLRTAPAPLFLLSRLVRDHGTKVVLTGEGADEVLAGYDIFKEAKVRAYCAARPDSRRRPRLLERLYPYLPGIRAQTGPFLRAFFESGPDAVDDPFFSHGPRWRTTSRAKVLFSREVRASLAGYSCVDELREALPERYGAWDPLCRAQYLETAILLPGYILSSQGDRVALAHGVEGRFPFLDHRIVELAATIPPRLKMRALQEKYLLKLAARGLVPEEVRARSKQPYRAPEAVSFFDPAAGGARFDWVDAMLAPARVREDGLFDPDAVGRLADKARRGRATSVADGMALVGVLSTQLLVNGPDVGRTVTETLHA